MIKKLFLIVAISLFIATNAYAGLVESGEGPKFITSCYMIGTTAVVSGDVVVLTDAADTTRTIEFYGKEVTHSTTVGEAIYGVVVDTATTDMEATDMVSGRWVRVQTYGYCPIISIRDGLAITVGHGLTTSATAGRADSGGATTGITGDAVALETQTALTHGTIKGFLSW